MVRETEKNFFRTCIKIDAGEKKGDQWPFCVAHFFNLLNNYQVIREWMSECDSKKSNMCWKLQCFI